MDLNRIINTDFSQEVLDAIDLMPIRELLVRLEVLTWDEEPIKEIQGVLTGGNININGKSSLRRTCSLNFITTDDTVEEYIQLDAKFKLFIGLKNHLPVKYQNLGDILWFKQGVFVFTKSSFTHNASGTSVSVTAQDKMCLLNGTCGGTIADFVVFHEVEMTVQDRIEELTTKQNDIHYWVKIKDGPIIQRGFNTVNEAKEWGRNWQNDHPDITLAYESYKNITGEEEEELALLSSGGYDMEDIVYVPVLVYTLIQKCVNHYGGEKLQNIRIDNVPFEAKSLLEYRGNRPVYLRSNPGQEPYYTALTFDESRAQNWDSYEMRTAGDLIGYKMTAFTWPGELSMSPGSTVTAVLDKIKSVLGNFEYFYDIDGIFHFQEIKNYLNNSYIPLTELSENQYEADFSTQPLIYSFKNKPNLITAYSNNPKYENIKNDFVVWGKRENANGSTTKVRYHLAIDSKPDPVKGDWREGLFMMLSDPPNSVTDEEGLNFYKKEMDAEWRKLYNPQNPNWYDSNTETYWNPSVNENPAALDYFIDFIDDQGPYGEWSVNKIGRRTVAKDDNDCVAVMNKRIPDYIFVTTPEEQDRLISEGYTNAFKVDQSFLENYLSISSNRKTCLDVIRELLYTHLTLNETISVTSLPIYWLEPNYLIEVEDLKTRIYGQYEINSISIPLTYNGTMTLQCSRVLNRI